MYDPLPLPPDIIRLKLNLLYIYCILANHIKINLLICNAKRNCLVSTWTTGTVENRMLKQNVKQNFDHICWTFHFLDLKSLFYEKPTSWRAVLQTQQGQFTAFHFLISFLKVTSRLISLVLFGTKSHLFDYTFLSCHVSISEWFHTLW